MPSLDQLLYISVAIKGYLGDPSIAGVLTAIQPLLFLDIINRVVVSFHDEKLESKDDLDSDTKKYMKRLSYKDSASFVKLTKAQRATIVNANQS